MAIANINNGESGSSVRGKLNQVIDEVSPIEAAAEGSVFQKGATNNEALTRENFGQQKEVFSKSVFGGVKKISALTAWDSLERDATTLTTMGNADSGQPYVQLSGTNLYNGFPSVRCMTGTGITGIANTGLLNSSVRGGFNLILQAGSAGVSNEAGAVFWVDANNWLKIVMTQTAIKIVENVSGVTTTIETIFFPNAGIFRRCLVDLNISYSAQSNLIFVTSLFGNIASTPYVPSAFLTSSNIAYFAFETNADTLISNWELQRTPFI